MRPVSIPNAPRDWHPIARRMWDSYKDSGQTDRWQQSDWAFAYSALDDLSRFKRAEERSDSDQENYDLWLSLSKDERTEQGFHATIAPRLSKGGSAMKMSIIMDNLARLGSTEADRLRVRIELTQPADESDDAEVIAIDDAKRRLGVVQ
jgi:hypothetical protein